MLFLKNIENYTLKKLTKYYSKLYLKCENSNIYYDNASFWLVQQWINSILLCLFCSLEIFFREKNTVYVILKLFLAL